MRSDIVIIGGGASGLAAAIGAARELAATENGGTVTVLEKMPKCGRKIMITGRGRCNFTNVKPWEDFAGHIRTDVNFLNPAFHTLPPEEVVALLKNGGLRSVVEHGDRAFPKSHMAGDVVDTLLRLCTLSGVKVVTGCEVKTIDRTPRGFSLDTVKTIVKEIRERKDQVRPGQKPKVLRTETTLETEEYTCRKLIVATGGLSYPGTGSTGDGLMWAEELGLGIRPCYPSLTALVPEGYKETGAHPMVKDIKAAFRGKTVYGKQKERKINPLPDYYPKYHRHIERITPLTDLGSLLEGNSLENVALTLSIGGEAVQREFGDLEFTDGGLEGAIGYRVSRKAVQALENGQKVALSLDMKPAVELDVLDADIHRLWQQVIDDPRSHGESFQRLFRIMLGKLIPWSITQAFLKMNPHVSVDTLAATLKDWKFPLEGFVGFERAVITAGGVDTSELVAKTLESRKVPGLYFCGEVLDIDADTGGYNLQLAFSTGFLAGESAVKAL